MTQPAPSPQRLGSTAPAAQRVLFYLPWEFDRLGGVDVVVDSLYAGLQNEALEPLIGIQSWHRAGRRDDADGRRFLDLNSPRPPTGKNAKEWLRYAITLARRLPALAAVLRAQRIEVVNCHFPTPHVFPLALLKLLGLWRGRMVLSFHGSDVSEVDMGSTVWRSIRRATDAVTTCSAYLAKDVSATGFCRLDDVVVAYNGIDAAAFAARRGATMPALPARYIASVSNFVPRKGQDLLLKAFAPLSEAYPDVDLVLAGGRDDGVWLGQLRRLARELNIEGRIHFLENLEHSCVPRVMSGALCLAHTSWAESFGLVLIEAGALGIPVIAAEVGGVPEVLGDCGRMYAAGDVAALTSLLHGYIEEPALAITDGRRLQLRVLERYSMAAQCAAFGAILNPEQAASRKTAPIDIVSADRVLAETP